MEPYNLRPHIWEGFSYEPTDQTNCTSNGYRD